MAKSLQIISIIASDVVGSDSSNFIRQDRDIGNFERSSLIGIDTLRSDSRIDLQLGSYLESAWIEGDKVVVRTDGGITTKVDKVILCTGYKYDFRRLQYMQEMLRENEIALGLSGRFPELDGQFRVQTHDSRPLPFHFIGHSASNFGPKLGLLESAQRTIEIVSASVRSKAE